VVGVTGACRNSKPETSGRPVFRVHGYDDLYVCDASVFPTSRTVNPQLTVMALAHDAAQRIEVPACTT
jgi:choline dehydrogenase-like flavoprotein